MQDKKAIPILMNLLKKRLLNAEEKEAVSSAIGLFSWTSLSKSNVKNLKAKREKSAKW